MKAHRWLVLAAMAAPLCAQTQDSDFVFKTETRLAMVRFYAIQKKQYVQNLKAEDIQLLEDGAPRKIVMFEGPGTGGRRTVPVEVILLFDVSMSVMSVNLLDPFALKETLLDGVGDHVGISAYAFAQRIQRFTGPTRDLGKLKQSLQDILQFAHFGTRLYEAITFAAQDAAKGGNNVTRLMIIFSDGEPTTRMKPEKAVEVANDAGIQLYPVVLGHERLKQIINRGGGGGDFGSGDMRGQGRGNPNNPGGGMNDRQMRARDLEQEMLEFARIGDATGGRSFDPPTVSSAVVRTILAGVVDKVRAEYVAGYDPGPSGETRKSHKVQVKLMAKDKGKLYGGVRSVVH